MDMHFDGVIFTTHALELSRRIERPWPPFVIVDVRPAREFAGGHIEGAIHAPAEALTQELPGGDPAAEFIVVGGDPEDPAVRAASLRLQELGASRIVELAGGMVAWRAGRYPTTTAAAA